MGQRWSTRQGWRVPSPRGPLASLQLPGLTRDGPCFGCVCGVVPGKPLPQTPSNTHVDTLTLTHKHPPLTHTQMCSHSPTPKDTPIVQCLQEPGTLDHPAEQGVGPAQPQQLRLPPLQSTQRHPPTAGIVARTPFTSPLGPPPGLLASGRVAAPTGALGTHRQGPQVRVHGGGWGQHGWCGGGELLGWRPSHTAATPLPWHPAPTPSHPTCPLPGQRSW